LSTGIIAVLCRPSVIDKHAQTHHPHSSALYHCLSARIVVKPGTKMLSMSSVSHVSIKHIKLLRRKSPSIRTSAVNSSCFFYRARTFDRVVVGRGCLLPRFFSRSLTPPLGPRFLFFYLFPITSTMSQRFRFKSGHGVWHWKKNKNSRVYLGNMAGLSCPCPPSEKIPGTKSHRM